MRGLDGAPDGMRKHRLSHLDRNPPLDVPPGA